MVGINLLPHTKFITSATCVISIIMDTPAVSCTPKQIDLQLFFVAKAASLCKSAAAQYKQVDINLQLHNTNAIINWRFHKVF